MNRMSKKEKQTYVRHYYLKLSKYTAELEQRIKKMPVELLNIHIRENNINLDNEKEDRENLWRYIGFAHRGYFKLIWEWIERHIYEDTPQEIMTMYNNIMAKGTPNADHYVVQPLIDLYFVV